VEVFGIEADHVGVVRRPEEMKASMASEVGRRISAAGSKGLASRQCFRWGGCFLGEGDVGFAGVIQAIGVPGEGLGLLDGALDLVAERTGPVDGELSAELVADLDGVRQAAFGVIAHFRDFGGGSGGEDGVVEGFGGDHGALEAVRVEALLDSGTISHCWSLNRAS
jgi:hypothetical protein